ncbi:MAG: hypothetical protein ACOYJY_04850 [Acutalibacteraceae bacterium]|jgi:hypothetical protein
MGTARENAKNEKYFFQYADEKLSDVITYRKNLIDAVKRHPKVTNNLEIQSFSTQSVTSERFKRFLAIAKAAGFTIYQVVRL